MLFRVRTTYVSQLLAMAKNSFFITDLYG